ncbi:hypothetical protein FE257_006553 [Aspergillus nanangensis]|uniref:Uncharacterized protein n=1 Tax=Aspergillus nanangensis TaxID=2582783 RepID=A0AAD4CXR6_ASPNN|nr:hypothetical protein FE257_006553 [Aspergillus nanangensis]
MEPTRQIHPTHWVTLFLQSILDSDAPSISLIVCSTRDSFLHKIHATAQAQTSSPANGHQLFTPPIGLLAQASRIKLIFCPTLEHLRAYLTVLRAATNDAAEDTTLEQAQQRPLLAILDLLALHVPTSEFSAQGLSRTLASAVEGSAREGMDLVLCECRDATDPADGDSGEALWYVQVPLLNSSSGRMSGQTVPVKRIVERWFEFQ